MKTGVTTFFTQPKAGDMSHQDEIQRYWVIKGIGVRWWKQSKFWHWGFYPGVVELGPITIYYD
jgi:hypothetical protein